ncbi:MAG: hypothetical protein OEV41_10025 [Gammaproteobacteria bacterium]|nr:hypothetical protein [Gammaproteobacteria bacterium]
MTRPALLLSLMLTAPIASAELEVVIIEGLGGEERYAQLFAEQVTAIAEATSALTTEDRVAVFRSGAFSREDVAARFSAVSTRSSTDDRLAVFLVGHGSYDDHEYKFNVAGPDIDDGDLRDWLAEFGGSALIVNTSSASGAIIDRIRADDRTVIAATRSGAERHATRFGGYFATALTDPAADLDKDRVVSAEEAFRYAERQVGDYYERNGQLATEHPRLEGTQAARFSLARLDAARPARQDAELTRLVEARERLNGDVESLRLRRDSMTTEDYQAELLQRMIELATLEDRIEARERELAGGN